MRPRYLFFAVLLALVAAGFARDPNQGQAPLRQLERGGQWRSWSELQRAAYVQGFTSGYMEARLAACAMADDLIESDPHPRSYPGDANHPPNEPSVVCLENMETYSRFSYQGDNPPDMSAYTDVITEFYGRHPEYDDVPFPLIMLSLGDRSHKTADQLYKMAQRAIVK